MSEVTNNVSKNENITFNNELINEVILHSGNRNTEKLTKLIDDLHPADLADLLTFLNSEQRSFTLSALTGGLSIVKIATPSSMVSCTDIVQHLISLFNMLLTLSSKQD